MEYITKRYKNDFNSVAYAKDYISCDDYQFKWYIEDFYHNLFSQGKLQGKTLIDVGCGPTNRAAVIASRYGCDVYCADISESNLNFVKSWLENGNEVFDFTPQFKHVAQLEGTNDIKYIEKRVKKSIKDVIYCDILADNPLHPRPFEQFDIVTSSMCLHCCPDEDAYLKGAKGIAKLVRSGGYLAFTNAVGTFYQVADQRFPVFLVNSAKAKKTLTDVGFKVLEVKEHYLRAKLPSTNDAKGFITIFAIKE